MLYNSTLNVLVTGIIKRKLMVHVPALNPTLQGHLLHKPFLKAASSS